MLLPDSDLPSNTQVKCCLLRVCWSRNATPLLRVCWGVVCVHGLPSQNSHVHVLCVGAACHP